MSGHDPGGHGPGREAVAPPTPADRPARVSAAGGAGGADHPGRGWEPVELVVARHSLSTAAVLVVTVALVALPVAVAVAITATVVSAGTTVGGVLVGLVVPLALLGFAMGVARPLVAGRRVVLVLRADALVIADRTLFHRAEVVPRQAIERAWLGPGVDEWLARSDPSVEVALAPDDEPVDLVVAFDGLVRFDAARRKVSRAKGDHRAALPHPEHPVSHLWVPLTDPALAQAALADWLPTPPAPAPAGSPPPPELR